MPLLGSESLFNYKLIYPVLLFAAMSSNEQCTSLRLKFAEGKK